MKNIVKILVDKLCDTHTLQLFEYKILLEGYSQESAEYAKQKAVCLRKSVYGNSVYIRGLIEISNICKNNCLYCGIRAENSKCERYRLTKEQILQCCDVGYANGLRTFVLQGGEDAYFTDNVMCDIITQIKSKYPECALTLSLGERSEESYKKLYNAGADRYLLRHETANELHYSKLHPKSMSLNHRLKCLQTLKQIGFQTGLGFMVGSPYQTNDTLSEDLKLVETFSPQMCGIGPFIPHPDTPFGEFEGGTVEFTCYLLSLIRIIKPNILLPATTALGSIKQGGRELGIQSGANVVMPNLSPVEVRAKYEIYKNKLSSGGESVQGLQELKDNIKKIGCEIVTDIGHYKE